MAHPIAMNVRDWRFSGAVTALLFVVGQTTGACVTSSETPAQIDVSAFVPPGEPGPYRVHEHELEEGLGVLYLPSSMKERPDATLFPFPVVLFAPGFSAGPRDYAGTAQYLASHGFAVIGADHGFNFVSATFCMTQAEGKARVERALDAARALSDAQGPYGGALAPGPVGTLGHSYGGKLALWLAATRDDVAAVVALDPVDGGDERRPGYCGDSPEGFPRLRDLLPEASLPPVLLFGAGRAGECAPADGNAEVLFAALPDTAERALLRLPEAAHQDFVDAAATDDCAACGFCPASGEAAGDVLQFSRAVAVAFFRSRGLKDAAYDAFLEERDDDTLLRAPPEHHWVEPGR